MKKAAPKGTAEPIDIIAANRYLSALTDGTLATFQTFDDKGKQPLANILHGTLSEHAEALTELNKQGAGVFVMVNEGDGLGRATANIRRIRALFVDTDGAPYPDPLPLEPHIIVQSSPNKWHLYWLVYDILLNEFAPLQKALAAHYGTDPAVCDLPRVMRLPGFNHCKAEPVRVELVSANEYVPFSRDEVLTAWPALAEALEAEQREQAERAAKRADRLKQAAHRKVKPTGDNRATALLQAHHDTVATAPEGQRHNTLLRAARALGGYIASGYLTEDEVLEALLAASNTCGLDEAEAEAAIYWGFDSGVDAPLDFDTPTLRPRSRRARQIARLRGERRA